MKAIEIQDRFGLDALKLVDKPTPKPGPSQVLIKLKALSLNFRDLMIVKGIYNPKLRLPFTPFSDGVGEIVEVGSEVTRVQVGQRVAGNFVQDWIAGASQESYGRNSLGGGGVGMLQEYVVLREEAVVSVPEHLSDEEAATLPCAALTAWHALVVSGGVKAGDSVLVLGTGGVSLFALQFAKMHGARVIATSSSDDKIARVRALGADETINYKTAPDWEEKVRALTDGVGVDHVVEVGGAGTLNKSLRAVRAGGHVPLIGVLSQGNVNPIPMLMKCIRVQGIFVGSREMFEAMNKALRLHKLKPVVDKVYPWTHAADALKEMESGSHFGKICLKVG